MLDLFEENIKREKTNCDQLLDMINRLYESILEIDMDFEYNHYFDEKLGNFIDVDIEPILEVSIYVPLDPNDLYCCEYDSYISVNYIPNDTLKKFMDKGLVGDLTIEYYDPPKNEMMNVIYLSEVGLVNFYPDRDFNVPEDIIKRELPGLYWSVSEMDNKNKYFSKIGLEKWNKIKEILKFSKEVDCLLIVNVSFLDRED